LTTADLPHLNVALNAASAVLLTSGFICIRMGRVIWHRRLMLSATVCACTFLVSYVIYHISIGGGKKYTGAYPQFYFPMLISHVLLAIVNVPLVVVSLRRAFRGRFDLHRKVARITLPVWWYVSVTGVLVYVMLYV
jgi:uncharacterized membrane protein YozB (DUF420 family)